MKKNQIITLLFFSFALFFSCKNRDQSRLNESGAEKIITLTSIEASFQDTAYFKTPQVVVLETTDESLLSEISRIITDDNLLFIFDNQLDQLFVFDVTGKFIHKINRKGQGPKEYVQVCDFTIDTENKQIILSADRPAKLMYFTYDGSFIKEDNLPDYYHELVNDGSYIYVDYYMSEETYQLSMIDMKSGFKKEGLEMRDIKNYLVIKGHSLIHGKDILFVRRYDNAIYELKNGEVNTKYEVDFKKHSFPERFKAETEIGVIVTDSRENKYVYSMSNAFHSENYLTFYTNIGIFIYDKQNETLKGYEKMNNTHLSFVMQSYKDASKYFLPLENSEKMVFIIEDPSFIKRIVDRNPEELKKDKDYKQLSEIAQKMTDDNNPVLFIYEYKD